MAVSSVDPVDVSVELADDEPPTKRLLQAQPLPGRGHVLSIQSHVQIYANVLDVRILLPRRIRMMISILMMNKNFPSLLTLYMHLHLYVA